MESWRDAAPRSRRGDDDRNDLFNDMYATYAPRVRALANSRLRGRGLADDVVQETFLRVHRNLDRFDLSLPPWPWLKMIATNVCTDVLRSRHGWAEQPVDDAGLAELPGGEAPADALLAKERRQGIALVLSGMNPRQRRALVLTGVEGWRAEQVADLEGSTVTAVRATLKRGRQAFRSSYLSLAAERGLLGVGAVLGSARTAFRKLRSTATSGGASTTAALGPLQLASAAFVSVALVGGIVVAAGPWSIAFGALDNIADTTPSAAVAPVTAAVDDGVATEGAASASSVAADAAAPAATGPGIDAGVAVPEAGAIAAIGASTSIDSGEKSSLLATVEGSLSHEAVAAPSAAGLEADLYCDHNGVRRAACDAVTTALDVP